MLVIHLQIVTLLELHIVLFLFMFYDVAGIRLLGEVNHIVTWLITKAVVLRF